MSISEISKISNLSLPYSDNSKISDTSESTVSFGDMLNNALNKVNDIVTNSEKITNDFAAGKTDSIHDVTIATEKADIALQFTMQIRNKILDAYSEIMRMQI